MNEECKHDYRATSGIRHAIYRPGYSASGEDYYECKKCGFKRTIKLVPMKFNESIITNEDLDRLTKYNLCQ